MQTQRPAARCRIKPQKKRRSTLPKFPHSQRESQIFQNVKKGGFFNITKAQNNHKCCNDLFSPHSLAVFEGGKMKIKKNYLKASIGWVNCDEI